jgi:Zn-dependent peptidase ImmA (M78 family)
MGTDAVPNLAEFLEEQGIKIIATNLPPAVSGMLCWVRRNDGPDVPVIILNGDDRGERQRFSLAHELGHLVMSVQGIDEEKACHRFAGAFLMMAEVLWREVGRHRQMLSMGELFHLKKLFRVSVQAIAYRCKDLGIIGQPAMRQLFAAFGRYGWRTPPYDEPEPVPKEVPRRFRRLCLRALAEETISVSRAAELLGATVAELHRMMDGPVTA